MPTLYFVDNKCFPVSLVPWISQGLLPYFVGFGLTHTWLFLIGHSITYNSAARTIKCVIQITRLVESMRLMIYM